MKPSIGRIVHYNSKNGTCAALVINVQSDELIDLQVFDRDGSTRHVTSVEQGETLGMWNWPPRV